MMKPIKIGIIFGGRSSEHEISIRSATTVIEQISKEKYDVIPIAIDRTGGCLSPLESINLLPAETRELIDLSDKGIGNSDYAFVGDTRFPNLVAHGTSEDASGRSVALDVVFPVLHGTYGEDGTIQGLLEMAGIPYVGCGVLASSCGMDKVVMKALFHDAGLPICEYLWFLRSEWEENAASIIDRVADELGYPCFVKPANMGSSVGVIKASNVEELKTGIALASEYDRKIVVEEYLDMREIECAVIGNEDPRASLPGEYIIFDESKKFLDYAEKYSGTGNNEFVVPARISEEMSAEIQSLAQKAFRTIDGSGFARVDFFLRADTKELLVNEINTIPGLTDASGFPKMWEGSGMLFPDVLDRLVELAFERSKDKLKTKTSR